MPDWRTVQLHEVADIRVSNVDKKAVAGELPVKLCNYMDVYGNDYIRADLPFMEATSTAAEIERFGVRRGDVMITKDSETPDDIGIPSVVLDDIEGLVCGYHLAQLRPREAVVDPTYLSKQLSLPETSAYFAQRATGSTRYGLSTRTIAQTPIRLAPLIEQQRIAAILTSLDTAIEATEALIEKHQQIKVGLMHDLFTRGVTNNGCLRAPSSEAPHVYRTVGDQCIPVDWQVERLDDLATRGSGHTPNKNVPEYWNGGIKWISLADSHRLDALYISETELNISHRGIQNSSAVLHPSGIVVLSRDAGVGKSAITTEPMAVSQHFMCWRCDHRLDNHFLYYWLQYKKRMFENIAMGSTILTIGLPYFKKLRIACPVSLDEQRAIAGRLKSADEHLFAMRDQLEKLRAKKQGLMQDLLTGKVRVPVPAGASA
jgi:type I restriction enzyme S subunit